MDGCLEEKAFIIIYLGDPMFRVIQSDQISSQESSKMAEFQAMLSNFQVKMANFNVKLAKFQAKSSQFSTNNCQ